MNSTVSQSTFLLTFLLSVGLFFFIRASTKDRTEVMRLASEQDGNTLMAALKEYFRSRAYRVAAVDAVKNQVTFEGLVSPSWFLAIFLTVLAFVGLGCLALVLSMLFPDFGQFFLVIILFSPLSGLLYWKKSGRLEKVSLKMENIPSEQNFSSTITVTAHRDELAELQRALQLKTLDT
ncbi:cofactor assembly of complex C subunit B [Dolichospermum sp. LEGE 00240]|uniref:cofactor assembly of complex C subunit B n=1 Tax=Dolichospermum sp. LEGE 00240 TaxID=1828603 RepID=UPI00187F0C49|nr:cofactor assembly of complex C subunit B [Dolichospermum sp. LEGE 00240]MBE9251073.1 cofactor assembly of complex C subunit B [Dolichospermum sp. LEGE 00240]